MWNAMGLTSTVGIAASWSPPGLVRADESGIGVCRPPAAQGGWRLERYLVPERA